MHFPLKHIPWSNHLFKSTCHLIIIHKISTVYNNCHVLAYWNLTEPSVTVCGRTLWHVQKAQVSHHFVFFSASSSVYIHLWCAWLCVCVTVIGYFSLIHISTRQDFTFMKQYHKSYHAYRVSLFSVIAFTAISPTSSHCSAQDVACRHHQQGTDQKKRKKEKNTFLSTGPSLSTPHQQMSRDYPILVERHRLCFCLWICFTHSKMSSIF